MKTSLLHLCLLTAATLAFQPSAQADIWFQPVPVCPLPLCPLPICPAPVPELPKPCRPCLPLPPTADPWDQLAVTGTDEGCVRLPGKPTRPTPTSAFMLPA
ncbi:MAG: hypothetical protein K9N47_22305 [Prosthecobacter sp.]|uniref:hypothetical protein n=1 Tax=Prosthecobacter sp. TaxID=1965333 RepID=UPI0026036AE0|nr:hypothetical protein [Prosthecobacter sp.]MCF7788874.1 hypothetical protein [Prosthecobacter sp.]